jgi:hypothetical protein
LGFPYTEESARPFRALFFRAEAKNPSVSGKYNDFKVLPVFRPGKHDGSWICLIGQSRSEAGAGLPGAAFRKAFIYGSKLARRSMKAPPARAASPGPLVARAKAAPICGAPLSSRGSRKECPQASEKKRFFPDFSV